MQLLRPVLILLLTITTLTRGQKNVGYFWHLTDLHYDTNFTNTGTIRNSSDFFDGPYDYQTCWVDGGGLFGDYACDAPFKLILSALRFVGGYTRENLQDRPFVIWTGDDTGHAENAYFSLDKVLDVVDILSSAISEMNLQVYPVMGNHDSYPKSQFPDDTGSELYARTADIWRNWLTAGGSDAYQQFKDNGGYYSVSKSLTGLPFNLVGLNTNVYYKSNDLVDDDDVEDPLGQFIWLENLLEGYRSSGEKALLFAHVTPGKFERYYQEYENSGEYGFHWFQHGYNIRYLEILEDFADVITGQFYGHQHCDSLKSFGRTWAALAPSVTPWRSTLAPETGANNPAVRLVEYDKDSGEILDYHQFYLNLAEANTAGVATWRKLYSFKEYYGLSDASADSINGLIEQIRSNQTMFSAYYLANTVAYEPYSEAVCDDECRRYHYCAMAKQDYEIFDDCVIEFYDSLVTDSSQRICVGIWGAVLAATLAYAF